MRDPLQSKLLHAGMTFRRMLVRVAEANENALNPGRPSDVVVRPCENVCENAEPQILDNVPLLFFRWRHVSGALLVHHVHSAVQFRETT